MDKFIIMNVHDATQKKPKNYSLFPRPPPFFM
jgi:hypothetical protein